MSARADRTNITSIQAEVNYVERQPGVGAVVDAVRRAPVVGLDTEFVGETTYETQLCLLQVAAGQRIFLVDARSGLDLGELWQALTAPEVEIIALAARQELLFCLRYGGRLPGSIFDPQVAAGLVGYGYPLSHANIVQQVLQRRVARGQAYTDWLKRPLSGQQLDYAADDVRHLHELRLALLDRATSLGRLGWLEAENRRLVDRLLEGEGEERWWRVSGATGLDRRGLALLRALWRWRDNAARDANLPARRIMSDDLMVQVVRRAPRAAEDLLALRGFNRPNLRRAAPDIVAAVEAALRLPERELPPLRRGDDPPQMALLSQLASILSNSLATEHRVDPALLATVADLQALIRWYLAGRHGEEPQVMQGWRAAILGDALIDLLQGRQIMRVGDVTSANPLVIEPRP